MSDNPREYSISTMSDILALTPEQRKRCVVDLLAWASWREAMRPLEATMAKAGVTVPDSFTWVDDGLCGTLSGVTISNKDTGEEVARVRVKA